MNTDTKKGQYLWHFITASLFGMLLILLVIILNGRGEVPQSVPLFDFFMLVLATFRVTRLFMRDLVFDFVRDFFSKDDRGLKLTIYDLLGCPWCTGAWVSLFLGYLYFLLPSSWPIIFILAIAGFGTLISIFTKFTVDKLEIK